MVGFTEDLKAVSVGQTCNVRLLADEMGKPDGDDFLAAVDSHESIPTDAIMRAVVRGGYERKVGSRSIKAHREQRCACFVEVPA